MLEDCKDLGSSVSLFLAGHGAGDWLTGCWGDLSVGKHLTVEVVMAWLKSEASAKTPATSEKNKLSKTPKTPRTPKVGIKNEELNMKANIEKIKELQKQEISLIQKEGTYVQCSRPECGLWRLVTEYQSINVDFRPQSIFSPSLSEMGGILPPHEANFMMWWCISAAWR